jgi:predicted Zn-dependent peptidase
MIINLKSQSDLSGFYIVYEGSTNLERSGTRGAMHLLEHLVCKTFFHLLEDFDRDGIDWNASTSSNEILFHFTGLESKLEKYRNKILKSLSNFDITKEQFENERNIVISEYEDSFNSQGEAHALNLYRKLFDDYSPIGLKSDLENLNFLKLIQTWEEQYLNPTKIINVSKTKKIKNLDIEFSNRKIVRNIEFGNNKVDFELGNEFKDKTSLIFLTPVVSENNAHMNFINAMLSLGLTSPLYGEIREKMGLVYYIHCFQSRYNLQGVTQISTLTNNKNVSKLIDGVERVLKNSDKFLTKERFNIVKEFYQTRREKEEILRYNNINRYLLPPGWSIYDILDTVKLKDLRDIYKQNYDFSKFYISNDKKEFQK